MRWFGTQHLGNNDLSRRTDALHSPAGAPQPSSSVNGAPTGRPVCVKRPSRGSRTVWPMHPRPAPARRRAPTRSRRFPRRTRCRCRRTRTRVPSEWSPSSAPRPSRPTTPRSRAIYGALLAGDRRQRARARADPAGRAARARRGELRAVQARRAREGRELGAPAVRGRARSRKPKGRRLRYAVGELLTARAARARGARSGWSPCGSTRPPPGGRSPRCSPPRPGTTCCRRPSRTCARTRTTEQQRAEAPALQPASYERAA